jgi:hypothetical protein
MKVLCTCVTLTAVTFLVSGAYDVISLPLIAIHRILPRRALLAGAVDIAAIAPLFALPIVHECRENPTEQ